MILDLLQTSEKWDRDIVLFADERGVWHFSINWRRVLPKYLRCSQRGGAAELGRRASAVIEDFGQAERDALKNLVAEAAHVRE